MPVLVASMVILSVREASASGTSRSGPPRSATTGPSFTVTGWPPSKRRVARVIQRLRGPYRGWTRLTWSVRQRVVQGDPQVLADGIVEGGHRPRGAQVAVHGLVGTVLGDVGDGVAVVAGLDALHAQLLGHGLVGVTGRRVEQGQAGVAGIGHEGLLTGGLGVPEVVAHGSELLGLLAGWCRSPPGRRPAASSRCSAAGCRRERRRVEHCRLAVEQAGAGRRDQARPRRRRAGAAWWPPRCAGWAGPRPPGTPSRAGGTAASWGSPSSVSSIRGYFTGGRGGDGSGSRSRPGRPSPAGAGRASATGRGGGGCCSARRRGRTAPRGRPRS